MDNRTSKQMTLEEIKEILQNHYKAPTVERELLSHKGEECYFFELSGTPPKGYGIYIRVQRTLCLYDAKGKRFKEYYLDKGIPEIDKEFIV